MTIVVRYSSFDIPLTYTRKLEAIYEVGGNLRLGLTRGRILYIGKPTPLDSFVDIVIEWHGRNPTCSWNERPGAELSELISADRLHLLCPLEELARQAE